MRYTDGPLKETDAASLPAPQDEKTLLRFLTCGSVDDGKSTLIGRLLHQTNCILEDQLVALERDSKLFGTTGDEIDFSLLVDGLEAERQQGITIDVAYRFFSTDRRKFIVADTPGHEEYTRNMATGASTADLAVVLVDARQGVLQQTRRHTFIAALLGIRNVVLAVNKFDLVAYDQRVFYEISDEFMQFAEKFAFDTIQVIPISALSGDNVSQPSVKMAWYDGPALLNYLETVPVAAGQARRPFRFPVQLVNRPDSSFRGYAGQVASGEVSVGDRVTIAKSGQQTRIKEIVTYDGSLLTAREGDAVTILLEDQVELSRGNMLVASDDRPEIADQFQAHVIWFDRKDMLPGRSYLLRTETECIGATITDLKYSIDVNSCAQLAAKSLHMNEIGVCNFSTQSAIAFDPFAKNRVTGNFIIIDRLTNATVGAGMIDFALRRADNVHWQALDVNKAARAHSLGQRPRVIWFTGLSGSGKSTIANLLEKRLTANGLHTYILDGDNIRHGLNRDLGFTDADRVENIRRVAEVAKLMLDAGLIVLVSFISPFRSERQMARNLMQDDFVEVFVDTPIEECAKRDPKGLYKKAKAGELKNFTGISSPYEIPLEPEIRLSTMGMDPGLLAARIEDYLNRSEASR
ncbi:sulfate adenylyltransferase subunit CysN [Rhizobium sullae]|uniref:sulfate adenylyltransferase subunit CysN n=1 Tax=Rhizobium sullae TaxID=50338 RepID=UPI000B354DED|nr:sulfate adenylyltransferase subunit CysN [Rhizobium sullae]